MDLQELTPKQKTVFYLGLFVIAIVLAFGIWGYTRSKGQVAGDLTPFLSEDSSLKADNAIEKNSYFVEITGQIQNPGVYELNDQTLVIELIDRAGGFTKQVDMLYVHKELSLAQYLQPAQKIYIPARSEQQITGSNTQSVNPNSPININTASIEQLNSLPGIGDATAQKIIAGRPYTKLEDLLNVSGIGPSTYNKIVSQIGI